MSCITDEVFSAWVSGELDDRELEQAEGHAADCVDCRAIAIALLGLVPRTGAMLGAVGATIGRYRVIAAVGQGAMGVVLRGHDPVLERDVAIKMVNAIATTAEQRERMLHEAKMLALVDHPNVVRVHDAGIVDDEVFVAMEYVTGTTLAHWLAETQRSLAARVEVLAGIGTGIAAIHVAGVVHRDIKPDNILVRGTRGVIVDFGLARSAGADGESGSGVVGTPRFIAPEVRTGGSASALADQYAWWTVVDDAMAGAVMPAGRRRALADAIARGRADDVARRFATMPDAVAALVAACIPPRPRWLNPALAGVTVIAVAAAALAIPGPAPSGHELAACSRAADEVRARWTGARERVHRAFASTGAPFAPSTFAATARILDAYVPAFAARVEAACRPADAGEPAAVTAARRRCLDQRAGELAAQIDRFAAVDRHDVHLAVDWAWAIAEPTCDDVRTLLTGSFGEAGTTPAIATQGRAARALYRDGKLDQALAVAESVLADTRAGGARAAELAALRLIGELRASLRQPDAAIEAFQHALGLAEAQGFDLDATMLLALLAEQHGVARQDPVAGHRMIELARSKLARIGGTNPVITGYLHRIDAQIYSQDYKCRDAEAAMQRAVADYEQAYGADHPHVGMALSELASQSCDETPEAIDAATRSVAILERVYGADHPNVGQGLVNLGNVLAGAGRPADARERLIRADPILAGAFGPDHPVYVQLVLSLGDVELQLGNREAALAAYTQIAPLVDASDGPRSQRAAGIHIRLGKVWLAGSRFAEAIEAHARAVAIIAAVVGADHIQMLEPLEGLARAHLALGQPGQAVPFAERALALLLEPANEGTADELGRDRWLLARALWDSGADRLRARALAEQARATLTGDPAREVDAWLATHEVSKTEVRR